MIMIKNDKLKIDGETFDVLAELGVIIQALHHDLKIPRELITNAYIIGLLGKDDD